MKVIIAEDDLALSLFLRNGLELDGHIVSCASDGLTALEHIEEHAPDLLVLDLGLPRMDGVDSLATELSAVTTQRSALLSTMAIVQKGSLFDYL